MSYIWSISSGNFKNKVLTWNNLKSWEISKLYQKCVSPLSSHNNPDERRSELTAAASVESSASHLFYTLDYSLSVQTSGTLYCLNFYDFKILHMTQSPKKVLLFVTKVLWISTGNSTFSNKTILLLINYIIINNMKINLEIIIYTTNIVASPEHQLSDGH